jgi:hypothetical protein
MKAFFKSKSLDLFGFWSSALCALHCAALPILVGFSFINMLSEPVIEFSLIALAILFALLSLLPDFLKYHRRALPLWLLFLGFVFIVIGRTVESSVVEVMGTVVGACIIASAHLINWRLLKDVMASKTADL